MLTLKQAVKCYEEAAKKGHAAAQYNLGLMYFNGQLGTKDLPRAIELIRKSARQGFYLNWLCSLS